MRQFIWIAVSILCSLSFTGTSTAADWKMVYIADKLPDKSGWKLDNNWAGKKAKAEIKDGAFFLDTTGFNGFWNYLIEWNMDNAKGVVVDVQLKVIISTVGTVAGVMVWVGLGASGQWISFYPDKVGFGNCCEYIKDNEVIPFADSNAPIFGISQVFQGLFSGS